jgi:chromosome segregation ATPase
LVTQLKARYVGEGSSLAKKDEDIVLLKAQLADVRAEVESTTAYARKLADEKLSLLVEVNQERGEMQKYRTNLSWGLRYLQEKKGEHFANINKLRTQVENAMKVQEGKLRKLSIDYDEELYPHLMSVIVERRYVSFMLFITFF